QTADATRGAIRREHPEHGEPEQWKQREPGDVQGKKCSRDGRQVAYPLVGLEPIALLQRLIEAVQERKADQQNRRGNHGGSFQTSGSHVILRYLCNGLGSHSHESPTAAPQLAEAIDLRCPGLSAQSPKKRSVLAYLLARRSRVVPPAATTPFAAGNRRR